MTKRLTLKEISEAAGVPAAWISQQIKDGKIDIGEIKTKTDGSLSMTYDLAKIYRTYGVCLRGYRPPSSDNMIRLLEIVLSIGKAAVDV